MRSLAGTIFAPLYSSPHDHVVAVVLRFPCRWPISPASQRNELPRRLPRVSLRSQLYSSTSSSPPPWLTNADDRLSLDPLGRVEGGDGIVEGSHVADVCPQPTNPDALAELT